MISDRKCKSNALKAHVDAEDVALDQLTTALLPRVQMAERCGGELRYSRSVPLCDSVRVVTSGN